MIADENVLKKQFKEMLTTEHTFYLGSQKLHLKSFKIRNLSMTIDNYADGHNYEVKGMGEFEIDQDQDESFVDSENKYFQTYISVEGENIKKIGRINISKQQV